MNIGIMRCKNEARWIERSIASILPLCDRVLVMDDHSNDGTGILAAGVDPCVSVDYSAFTGLDETRDKNVLLAWALGYKPEWIICIDGDEMLTPESMPILQELMHSKAQSISVRIPYLWDSEDQIRVDGVYGEFRRHSLFRPGKARYTSSEAGGFHCGNVPIALRGNAISCDQVQLLHFGYMHAKDRARKYAWYNAMDPGNEREDHYRHIAAGLDIMHDELIEMQIRARKDAGLSELTDSQLLPKPPLASEKTMHAGPMEFRSIR